MAMKRPLRPDESRLWAVVAATVRPAPGRQAPPLEPAPEPAVAPSPPKPPKFGGPVTYTARNPRGGALALPPPKPGGASAATPSGIEPNRRRRIARDRDGLAARLDLHGLDQDGARLRLIDFLVAAQADGARAVLVISGKGFQGEGVLRRRTPEWLADPRLKGVVAGLSPAEDRHGGGGAWYVALKRRPR
jgi:DNA-nicking Smr family endonuclease